MSDQTQLAELFAQLEEGRRLAEAAPSAEAQASEFGAFVAEHLSARPPLSVSDLLPTDTDNHEGNNNNA